MEHNFLASESALDARRPVRYRTAPKKMHEERKPPNGRAEDAKREKFCCNAENTNGYMTTTASRLLLSILFEKRKPTFLFIL